MCRTAMMTLYVIIFIALNSNIPEANAEKYSHSDEKNILSITENNRRNKAKKASTKAKKAKKNNPPSPTPPASSEDTCGTTGWRDIVGELSSLELTPPFEVKSAFDLEATGLCTTSPNGVLTLTEKLNLEKSFLEYFNFIIVECTSCLGDIEINFVSITGNALKNFPVCGAPDRVFRYQDEDRRCYYGFTCKGSGCTYPLFLDRKRRKQQLQRLTQSVNIEGVEPECVSQEESQSTKLVERLRANGFTNVTEASMVRDVTLTCLPGQAACDEKNNCCGVKGCSCEGAEVSDTICLEEGCDLDTSLREEPEFNPCCDAEFSPSCAEIAKSLASCDIVPE